MFIVLPPTVGRYRKFGCSPISRYDQLLRSVVDERIDRGPRTSHKFYNHAGVMIIIIIIIIIGRSEEREQFDVRSSFVREQRGVG